MSLVLVADDEPAVLEVLTEVVEDLGHEVVRAHDGREALQIARAQRPNLVVTDHMMPRLSGLELCRAMRAEDGLKSVPVILLSAALPPEAAEAYAYLAKPFELDEFEALVKRTLEGLETPGGPLPAPRKPVRNGQSSQGPSEDLINWVAHELKTPLAAAKMSLQLIERRTQKDGTPPERQQFQAVSRQLDNMEHIVAALLDSTRLSEGRLELITERGDLRDPVLRVLGEWRELQPDFQFELLLPDQPLATRFDDRRVRQIVGSLISNAVRYGAPPRHVRVEVGTFGNRAEVRVQDFGPGIPISAQRSIFERFRPGEDGRGKGHGLGLYIAHQLARLHAGEVTVKSVLGQGAVFTLALPLAT